MEGARQLGFVFSVRTPQHVTISTVNTAHISQFHNDSVIVDLSTVYTCV